MPRDDFDQKTKRSAAQRVAYRCCFENCGRPTIGAKDNDISGTTNIGVACHICAASSNGPRYDPTMTPEERKSIENCIWMCQVHAHLIDEEEKKYTVEVLREWKNNAERQASEAISNYRISENELKDPQKLSTIFDALIKDGNYDVLKCILEQNSNFSEDSEILLRYNVIYAIYCNRGDVVARTQQYIDCCKNPNIDALIKYFIIFNVRSGINLLIPLCSNQELRLCAETILNNTIEGTFIGQKDNTELITISDKDTFIKLLSTYIVDRFTSPLQDVSGKTFNVYDAEFSFNMRKLAWQMIHDGIQYEKYYSEQSQNENYIILKNNFYKIKQLDVELQKIIWVACLNYTINHKEVFREVYGNCPLFVQELDDIKRIVINFSSIHKLENNNSLLDSCIKNNQEDFIYDILRMESEDKQKLFLDDHKYLLKSHVELLFLWVRLLPSQEAYSTIQSYEEFHNNSFLWHCMDAYYAPDKNKAEKSLNWLNSNTIIIPYGAIDFYTSVLKKYEQWEALENLLQDQLSNYFKYRVVLALSTMEKLEIKNKCIENCNNLELTGFQTEGFYYNFAVLYCSVGDIENAKKYFEKEYIAYPKIQVLIQLLQLRYQTKEFKKDDFYNAACKADDFHLQHIVAAINYESADVKEAKFYIVRSLLANADNANALNAYFIWESEHPNDGCFINDKIYYLKNDNSSIKVAVHDSKLLDGITPQNFMGCLHLDCHDERVLTWDLEDRGNTVQFENQDYLVEDIKPFTEGLNIHVFSQVLSSEKTLKITGESPEDAVENLRQQLLAFDESKQQLINTYNQLDGKYPLSIFSKSFGHGLCNTWSFILCENNKKVNNNIIFSRSENDTYLLSIDAIQTLGLLEVLDYFDVSKLLCPKQTKLLLLEEFNRNIQDIKSTSVGSLGVSNGMLAGVKYTSASKKSAISYWVKMKKFVEPIKEVDGSAYTCLNQDVQKFFIEQDLIYESYLLGTMQKANNTTLVTDDPFLSFVCEMENIPYISTVNLFLLCKFDFETWISILDKLKKLNFSNYITPSIYKRLINSIVEAEQSEQRDKNLSSLNNWLLPQESDIEHSKMIINLYRYLILEDQKSYYAHFLVDVAFRHYIAINPDSYQQFINDFLSQFSITPQTDDSGDESE